MGVQLENNLSEEKNERAFYEPYQEKSRRKHGLYPLYGIGAQGPGTDFYILYSVC